MKPMKTKIPKEAVGYCGIVIPDEDAYSGIFIIDLPSDRKGTNLILASAIALGGKPTGSLTAILVEGFTTGREDLVRYASLALRSLNKDDFFVVAGTKMVGGTATTYQLLDATTIEEAREALENLPSVVEIKLRIQAGLAGRKPS